MNASHSADLQPALWFYETSSVVEFATNSAESKSRFTQADQEFN